MQIRRDGLVYITERDITPIKCERCGVIYQPDCEAAVGSRCRNCGMGNWHADQYWKLVAEPALYVHISSCTHAKIYDRPDDAPND